MEAGPTSVSSNTSYLVDPLKFVCLRFTLWTGYVHKHVYACVLMHLCREGMRWVWRNQGVLALFFPVRPGQYLLQWMSLLRGSSPVNYGPTLFHPPQHPLPLNSWDATSSSCPWGLGVLVIAPYYNSLGLLTNPCWGELRNSNYTPREPLEFSNLYRQKSRKHAWEWILRMWDNGRRDIKSDWAGLSDICSLSKDSAFILQLEELEWIITVCLVKVWVTLPDKEAWQAEVLAEDRKNTEWIVGGK